MLLSQIEKVSLEELVKVNHQYGRFKELFNLKVIECELKSIESTANYKGYGVNR